jgi:hypothetical protein
VRYQFERRPYGPESTPAELKAIGDCIYVYEPDVFYWREVPVMSVFQVGIFEQRLNILSSNVPYYDLLIDLIETNPPPNAQIRERLKQVFSGQKKLRRAAVFTGKNFMLNVAAKFVLGGSIGLKNFSVHQTIEQAVERLRHDARE